MTRPLGYAVLAALVMTASAPLARRPARMLPTDAAARSAIDAGNRAWADAIRANDVQAMLSVYGPHPVSLASSGTVTSGRDSLETRMKRFYSMYKGLDAATNTLRVWLVGNSAWEYGTYTMTVLSPTGDTVRFGEQYMARWDLQRDGTWKTGQVMTFPHAADSTK